MEDENKHPLSLKMKYVFFTFFYGIVKYFPGDIPGNWLRAQVLKLFARKVGSWRIGDGTSFYFPWGISIGKNVAIGEHCFIDGYGGLEIGDWTIIAHNCSIIPENHGFERLDIPIHCQKLNTGPIKIGNNVWIGCGVRVLKGVEIGDGAVIGAGSVVTKNIPSNAVAVGVPAKVIRYRTAQEVVSSAKLPSYNGNNIDKRTRVCENK